MSARQQSRQDVELAAHLLRDGTRPVSAIPRSGFLPALQIVSLAGMAGMVFLLALQAAQGPKSRYRRGLVASVALLVGAAIAYGVE